MLICLRSMASLSKSSWTVARSAASCPRTVLRGQTHILRDLAGLILFPMLPVCCRPSAHCVIMLNLSCCSQGQTALTLSRVPQMQLDASARLALCRHSTRCGREQDFGTHTLGAPPCCSCGLLLCPLPCSWDISWTLMALCSNVCLLPCALSSILCSCCLSLIQSLWNVRCNCVQAMLSQGRQAMLQRHRCSSLSVDVSSD